MNPKDDFTHIKMELVNEIKGMRKDLDEYIFEQREHREIIFGNPIKKQRGLSERLNTLEDGNIKKDQWNLAIIPTILLMIAERIWFYLTGHLK